MEKQDTDRRMLAPKTSMDSTLKKLHQEPISHFPSSNTKHKVRTTTITDPDVQNVQIQLKKSSSRRGSKSKESSKGSRKEDEIVKFQNPLKEEKEQKERLSSGAIVKIKEMKISEEITEHDLTKQREVALISGSNVGRRRSLCGSQQVELSEFLTDASARIVSVDMPPFMQIHAVGCARKARDSLENFSSKALALTLKKEFDVVYGPAWHCIVGSSFGSFVTHSVGGFLYFSLDQKFYVLLFKTSVQKAD